MTAPGSVVTSTSWISRTFGPVNISLGGRLRWAFAKPSLLVRATKSSKERHLVLADGVVAGDPYLPGAGQSPGRLR